MMDGRDKSGSHSLNPLKKLKKKFNKVRKHQGSQENFHGSTEEEDLSSSDTGSFQTNSLERKKKHISKSLITSSFRAKRIFKHGSTKNQAPTPVVSHPTADVSQVDVLDRGCDSDSFKDSYSELNVESGEEIITETQSDDSHNAMEAEAPPNESQSLEIAPQQLIEISPDKTSTEVPEIQTTHTEETQFRIELTIISGSGLVAMDRNGFSDPYVKVKYLSKTAYKTRVIDKCLNPTWNEAASITLKTLEEPIIFRMFDHDTFKGDDFMGAAKLEPSQLSFERSVNLSLDLELETADNLNLGQLHIRCILHSDNSSQQVVNPQNNVVSAEPRALLNMIKQDSGGSVSEWDYTVRIVLVEGYDLLPMDGNGLSDPYVKFTLQNRKYKSKVKNKKLCPVWNEEFSMHLYDQKGWNLDVNVYDYNIAGRADFMGRTSLNLSELSIDKTYDMKVHLEDEAGTLRLLVTITGAVSSTDHEISNLQRDNIVRKYGLLNSFKDFSDVGWLQVKIIRANGLSSKDWGGKSDPFCTVELINTMLQTNTSYKTLNPEWNRCFTLPVNDIHSVLVITIYDEDNNMEKEFIGKISIPLVMIENGVLKWYGLKDRKSFNRVKGAILLELDLIFNHFKAAVRTLNPREEKAIQEEPRFKISMFKRNVSRIKVIAQHIIGAKDFWQNLIEWKYPSQTLPAFIAFLTAVWNFQLYMLPLILVMLFVWNYIVKEIKGYSAADDLVMFEGRCKEQEGDEEDEEAADTDGDGQRTFREYIDTIKSICCTVQEVIGQVCDLADSLKNSVNWTIPWLSALAVIVLIILTFILYMVPLRYIVLLWGINKFTKNLRNPNHIPNNELLDYLSRVPSDVEKMMYREIRPDIASLDSSDGKPSPTQSKKRR